MNDLKERIKRHVERIIARMNAEEVVEEKTADKVEARRKISTRTSSVIAVLAFVSFVAMLFSLAPGKATSEFLSSVLFVIMLGVGVILAYLLIRGILRLFKRRKAKPSPEGEKAEEKPSRWKEFFKVKEASEGLLPWATVLAFYGVILILARMNPILSEKVYTWDFTLSFFAMIILLFFSRLLKKRKTDNFQDAGFLMKVGSLSAVAMMMVILLKGTFIVPTLLSVGEFTYAPTCNLARYDEIPPEYGFRTLKVNGRLDAGPKEVKLPPGGGRISFSVCGYNNTYEYTVKAYENEVYKGTYTFRKGSGMRIPTHADKLIFSSDDRLLINIEMSPT